MEETSDESENISIGSHSKELERFTRQIKTADRIIFADSEVSRVTSLILQNGGSHVQLKGVNTQALNTRYDKSNLLSIKIYNSQMRMWIVGLKIFQEIQVLAAQQRTNLAEVNSKEARTSSDSYYLDFVSNILRAFGDVKGVFDLSYYYGRFMNEVSYESENIWIGTHNIESNGGKVLVLSTLTAIDKDIRICPANEDIENLIIMEIRLMDSSNDLVLQTTKMVSRTVNSKDSSNYFLTKTEIENLRLKTKDDFEYYAKKSQMRTKQKLSKKGEQICSQ